MFRLSANRCQDQFAMVTATGSHHPGLPSFSVRPPFFAASHVQRVWTGLRMRRSKQRVRLRVLILAVIAAVGLPWLVLVARSYLAVSSLHPDSSPILTSAKREKQTDRVSSTFVSWRWLLSRRLYAFQTLPWDWMFPRESSYIHNLHLRRHVSDDFFASRVASRLPPASSDDSSFEESLGNSSDPSHHDTELREQSGTASSEAGERTANASAPSGLCIAITSSPRFDPQNLEPTWQRVVQLLTALDSRRVGAWRGGREGKSSVNKANNEKNMRESVEEEEIEEREREDDVIDESVGDEDVIVTGAAVEKAIAELQDRKGLVLGQDMRIVVYSSACHVMDPVDMLTQQGAFNPERLNETAQEKQGKTQRGRGSSSRSTEYRQHGKRSRKGDVWRDKVGKRAMSRREMLDESVRRYALGAGVSESYVRPLIQLLAQTAFDSGSTVDKHTQAICHVAANLSVHVDVLTAHADVCGFFGDAGRLLAAVPERIIEKRGWGRWLWESKLGVDFVHAMQQCLHTNPRFVLVLEDDVMPAWLWDAGIERFLTMDLQGKPPWDLVALYYPSSYEWGFEHAGVYTFPCCTQADLFTAQAGRDVMGYVMSKFMNKPRDMLLGEFVKGRRLVGYAHVPSLFQHTGMVRTFRGTDFHRDTRFASDYVVQALAKEP